MSNVTPSISIVGNVVNDPELRFTQKGVACANFSVAVNRKTFDAATKRWEDAGTDFHRVTAWRSMAENIANSIKRGDRVIVIGDMRSNEYEDREGNKRIAWEITANAVGPDLMFASATAERTDFHKKSDEKSNGNNGRDSRNGRK